MLMIQSIQCAISMIEIQMEYFTLKKSCYISNENLVFLNVLKRCVICVINKNDRMISVKNVHV